MAAAGPSRSIPALTPARRAPLGGLALLVLLGVSGCVTARPGSLSAWVVDGQQELNRQATPEAEGEVYSASGGFVRLVSAVNDVQSIQIAVRSTHALSGPAQLRLGDLSGPAGALAAREVYQAFRVADAELREFPSWYPRHTGRWISPRSVPDILVPWTAPRGGGPLTFRGQEAEIVWLDVFVPPTAVPGEYRGSLELVAGRSADAVDAASLFRCEVRLTVLPVAIPGELSLDATACVDPRGLLHEHFNWPLESAAETRILPAEGAHQPALRLMRNTFTLLHEHRLSPVLWGSFPKYHVSGVRSLSIEWEPYDQLVGSWISGDAYSDRVAARFWPLPVSDDYPSAAREGGFSSESYSRLLADYLRACGEHFAERGWSRQAILRTEIPQPLNAAAVDRVRRAAAALHQADRTIPLLAHLPLRSLHAFGWREAPPIDLSNVALVCPTARWLEPAATRSMQALGKRVWFVPDDPPYSGSLSLAGLATDATALGWQAARYGLDGIWIDAVAPPGVRGAARSEASDPLLLPGRGYGLTEEPIPTVRLKRLRRGLLDAELIALLRRSGQPLLAERTTQALAGRAFLDACAADLLTCRESGWSGDPRLFALGRRLVLQELANHSTPTSGGRAAQVENLSSWTRLRADRAARLEISGVRLGPTDVGLRAVIDLALSNPTDAGVSGSVALDAPPLGWVVPSPSPLAAAAGALGTTSIELVLNSLAYDADGAAPFSVGLKQGGAEPLQAVGRLAVTGAPRTDAPIRVDGSLDDWPGAPGNRAGGFLLVNAPDAGSTDAGVSRSANPQTQAMLCRDDALLYVALRAELLPGTQPRFEATNAVRVQGAQPWGEDVLELLFTPPGALRGNGEDLLVLQLKPNGVAVGRKGCLTDPPIYRSSPWPHGATVASHVASDAWVVEAAVPLASLAIDADTRVVGFNVTRLDSRSGQYSSWSGARVTCYRPELLGNLLLPR